MPGACTGFSQHSPMGFVREAGEPDRSRGRKTREAAGAMTVLWVPGEPARRVSTPAVITMTPAASNQTVTCQSRRLARQAHSPAKYRDAVRPAPSRSPAHAHPAQAGHGSPVIRSCRRPVMPKRVRVAIEPARNGHRRCGLRNQYQPLYPSYALSVTLGP